MLVGVASSTAWSAGSFGAAFGLIADVVSPGGQPVQATATAAPLTVIGEAIGGTSSGIAFTVINGYYADETFATLLVTISGTVAEPVASVSVNSIAATVNATALTWVAEGIVLKPGANPITATATDLVGLTASHTITVYFDAQPPPPPTVDPLPNPTQTAVVTLSGTKATNTSIWLSHNGAVETQVVALNGATTWQAPFTLTEHLNTLTVRTKDAANNPSLAVVVTVLLDQLPPEVAISNPVNNSFSNQPTVTVSGTTTPDTSVLDVNGLVATFNKTNPSLWIWTVPNVPLLIAAAEGQPTTLTATATNQFGQTSTTSVIVTYDVTAPAPPGVDPVPSPTAQNPLPITGTKELGAGIMRDGQPVVPIGDPRGTWSDAVTLTLGPNTFTYVQIDQAGNVSDPAVVSVVFDNTPPTQPVVVDEGQTTPNDTQLQATATSSETETAISDWCWALGDTTDPNPLDGYNNVVDFSCTGQGGTSSQKTFIVPTPLTHGVSYLMSAKAINQVGLGAVGSSDGIVSSQPPVITSVSPPDLSAFCKGAQIAIQVTGVNDPDDPTSTIQYAFTVTYTPTNQQVFSQPLSLSAFALWSTASQLSGVYALQAQVKDPYGASATYPGVGGAVVLWEIALFNCAPPKP